MNEKDFPPLDRVVDWHELLKLVPYSRTYIWRLESRGHFPKRIKLGPQRVGWSLNEVMAWFEERKAERDLAA